MNFEPPPPSPTQLNPTLVPIFTPLSQPKLISCVFAVSYELSQIMSQSKSGIQSGTIHLFVEPIFLLHLLDMHVPCRKLLQVSPELGQVLRGKGSAKRGLQSVEKLLQSVLGFGRRVHERPKNSH